MDSAILEKFLTGTDHTGRFIITSKRTGRRYFVEPIGDTRPHWGDMDPATKQVSGDYGRKYRGSIDPEESLITEKNGFENIRILEKGTSPILAIEEIDSQYPSR